MLPTRTTSGVVFRLIGAAVTTMGMAGCGITGADPTGTVAMMQFEAQRRQSMEMQRQVTSVEAAEEREANLRSAIEFCRHHPEVQGCSDAVRDEAKTMETMRKMRSIGSR
jgi:hypothetical protein